jgi:hypothetical protein
MSGRKLFLTHAGELAHRVVRAVARQGLAAQFVRSYAERHQRPKITANPERLREVESTISREALLVIAATVHRLLPRTFEKPRGVLRPEDAALSDAFYSEFLESLARALEWPATEAQAEALAFRRDLTMYARWAQRPVVSHAIDPKGGESPFSDRCAILLDPAMMEQARRAAVGFEIEITRLANRIFKQLGRRTASHKRRPPPAKKRTRQNTSKKSSAKSKR